jgi:SulP family sulfate permease
LDELRDNNDNSLEMAMWLTFFAGLRPLSRGGAIRDAIAGLTLASMNIPQVLGYTRIAGTPAVTGLYTLLPPLLMFAILGSSHHMVVAADSATAAIFSSGLSGMAAQASGKYMALVGMVALLTAALLLLARIFKPGFLADFLSRTVLAGFLTGIGFQIGIAMLGEMSGIPVNAYKTIDQLQHVIDSLHQVNFPTLCISALVVSCIPGFRHFLQRLPTPLFAVLAGK